MKLNLNNELAKGGHYYEIPALTKVGTGTPLPLNRGMNRFLADSYLPIRDEEPATTKRFKILFENSYHGNLKAEEFSPELCKQIAPNLRGIEEDFKKQGKLQSFTLVERNDDEQQKNYRYLIEYENVTILQRFVLNGQNKLTIVKGELWEWKSK